MSHADGAGHTVALLRVVAKTRKATARTSKNLAAGRPNADLALVTKVNETTSYSRLVIASSNFAGKEFALDRPTMTIGRADENDLVINHRSISRNHAKVTYESETGRYTISDLQSTNGVLVNGNAYGKVQLRRGDYVDRFRCRFSDPAAAL